MSSCLSLDRDQVCVVAAVVGSMPSVARNLSRVRVELTESVVTILQLRWRCLSSFSRRSKPPSLLRERWHDCMEYELATWSRGRVSQEFSHRCQMSYASQVMRKEQQPPTGAATIRRNLCQDGPLGSAIRWPATPLGTFGFARLSPENVGRRLQNEAAEMPVIGLGPAGQAGDFPSRRYLP